MGWVKYRYGPWMTVRLVLIIWPRGGPPAALV